MRLKLAFSTFFIAADILAKKLRGIFTEIKAYIYVFI